MGGLRSIRWGLGAREVAVMLVWSGFWGWHVGSKAESITVDAVR